MAYKKGDVLVVCGNSDATAKCRVRVIRVGNGELIGAPITEEGIRRMEPAMTIDMKDSYVVEVNGESVFGV